MKILFVVIMLVCSATAHAQIADSGGQSVTLHAGADSQAYEGPRKHLYHVNPWITGGIIVAGGAADLLSLSVIRYKPAITDAEFDGLNRDVISRFDRWALNLNTTGYAGVEIYATVFNYGMALLPLSLFANSRIGNDWGTVLALYLEAQSVSLSMYMTSPLGPLLQNKYRPIVYYNNLTRDERRNGNNRNSFYSGHVASVATATFFMAKVYSDYHPELGMDKLWLYAAATVPPLALGYIRIKGLNHFPSDVLTGFGVGMLCGILIPELHKYKDNKYSFGLYSLPESSGLRMEIALE